MIALNDICPDFSLPSTSGDGFVLSQVVEPLVVYFYPKDNTPGCTNEAIAFNMLYDKFKSSHVSIVGISRDSLKSHENFKIKHGLKFDLLSDKKEIACQLFGVIKEKNLYGKKAMGIERSTFLLDSSHKVIQLWRGVKVPGHAKAVLKVVLKIL